METDDARNITKTISNDMNIYLDVDGTLLTKEGQPAPHLKEFLEYVTTHHTPYWLTTRCKGDATAVVEHLRRLLPSEVYPYLLKIRPTNWDVSKTEPIDFSQPFLWFDDVCFEFERDMLKKHGVFENWIEVNLQRHPDQLRVFIENFPLPLQSLS